MSECDKGAPKTPEPAPAAKRSAGMAERLRSRRKQLIKRARAIRIVKGASTPSGD